MQEYALSLAGVILDNLKEVYMAASGLDPFVTAVLIYVIGQYALKIIIEPAQQLKKTLGEVDYFILCYGVAIIPNFGTVKEDESHFAYKECRRLAAKIYSDARVIPLYSIMCFLFFLPRKNNIKNAAEELNVLANFCYSKNENIHEIIRKKIEPIKFKLGLV